MEAIGIPTEENREKFIIHTPKSQDKEGEKTRKNLQEFLKGMAVIE